MAEIILTNGDVLRASPALQEVSGGHTDATELKILRIIRKVRPVAEDLRTHLQKVAAEYQEEEEGTGKLVWIDQAAYAERERAILQEEAVMVTEQPFEKKHFKKLPAGRILADLGPLFHYEEQEVESAEG